MTYRKSVRDQPGGNRSGVVSDEHTDAFYAGRRDLWERNYSHSLEDEIEFIDKLGAWANTKFSRKSLLQGYLAGLSKRTAGFTAEQMGILRARAEIGLRTA